MDRSLAPRRGVALAALVAVCALSARAPHARVLAAPFVRTGDLIVSGSVYTGSASTVTVGQTLPGGGTAVANGSYPGVWANEGPDPSFGVTAPIVISRYTVDGSGVQLAKSFTVPTREIVTSFSSKSELGLNLSTDGSAVTFMGYVAPPDALDVSNSNTPNHVDPTNPVALTYQRAVAQIHADGSGDAVTVTPVDAYSGNNGRAAILASAANEYLMVGNAGNGGSPEPVTIVDDTGVQLVAPHGGPETTVVGIEQGTPGAKNGFQYGFSVTSLGLPADKSGKDDNFRGMTIFNNTLYVDKGSGSNGVNTVYQVGTAGTLPTAATAATTPITILPGFPTTPAKSTTGVRNPFGLWFANDHTLYVADEGDGVAADASSSTFAGLEKWVLESDNQWHNVYTLQAGLDLGVPYAVPGLDSALNPATDGLRGLTGQINGDGTVTLYATTSTVSASADQGADPNKLVAITDAVDNLTAAGASGESFRTLASAAFGQVLRGVVFVPAAK